MGILSCSFFKFGAIIAAGLSFYIIQIKRKRVKNTHYTSMRKGTKISFMPKILFATINIETKKLL